MKICVLILAFIFSSAFSGMGQEWQKIAEFPGTPRDDASGFSLNGKGYFGLGIDYGYLVRKDMYSYNPAWNEWHQVMDLPGMERQYATSLTVGDCAYIIGGSGAGNIGNLNEVWMLCEGQEWHKLQDGPYGKRASAAGFVIGKNIYYGTGRDSNRKLNDFWKFNTESQQWTALKPPPFGERDEAIGFATKTHGYIIMGNDTGKVFYKDVWKFDPSDEQWHKISRFPGKAYKYAAGVDIGEILVISGGIDSNEQWVKEAWAFNGTTESWLRLSDYPAYIRGMEGFPLRNSAVLCTGLKSDFSRSIDCWKMTLGSGAEQHPFPNPVINELFLPLTTYVPGEVLNFRFLAITGATVMEGSLTPAHDVAHLYIGLEEGLYILQYDYKGVRKTHPLVISK